MRYVRWLGRMLWFPVAFGWAVVKANVLLGGDIVTPKSWISGGFVEVPLRCRTDTEISMLANMVTLTPGTSTVAVRRATPTLWVQGLYLKDPADLRREVYALEDLLLGVSRVDGAPSLRPALGSWRGEGRA